MSKVSIEGNALGSGTFTIAAPNSNTSYTLTLPESTGTMVVTGGAQTIEFAAGTVSAPSITTTGDTNTGIFFPAADTIAFAEGGAEAMRINSSGNVGIGTTSPSTFGKFAVQTSTSSNTPVVAIADNSLSPLLNHYITDSGSTVRNLNQIAFNTGSSSSANYQGFMTFSTMASAGGTISERMRITAAGLVSIGTASAVGQLTVAKDGERCLTLSNTATGSAANQLANFLRNGSEIGAITSTNTTTTYATSSDYRLKENIAPMTGALATVAQLKPCTYTWKVDGSAGQGFIAHELQAVVPDAVYGEKDAVETYIDEEDIEQTRPVYQGVDTSFLVATLTAAIQELKAELDEAKARIATLEAGA